jgi:DNA-binding transcriptional LysR family regulator
MDLKRLSHLIALAEEGSFSRAAHRSHLSQPAFSRSIAAAEQDIGVSLFERRGGQVECTPAGRFVIERVRRVVADVTALKRDIGMFMKAQIGSIAIGAGPIAAELLLPGALVRLRTGAPEVVCRVHIGTSNELVDSIKAGHIELGAFMLESPGRDRALVAKKLIEVSAGLFVRAGHPLASRRRTSAEDLALHGVASIGVPARSEIRAAQLLGVQPRNPLPIRIYCDNLQQLKRLALASDTVLLAPAKVLEAELASGALREIISPGGHTEPLTLYAVWRAQTPLSPLLATLLEFLTVEATALQAG